MPVQNQALEGFTVQQIGALLGRLAPDQQLSFVRELRRRFGLVFEVPAQPAWERDEFTELVYQGNGVRFVATGIAAAVGNNSMLEVGNGTAPPTTKVLLIKRAIICSPVNATYELRSNLGNGYQTGGSVVGPAVMRGPAPFATPLGSFPAGGFVGGSKEANALAGNVLAATLAANTVLIARLNVLANSSGVFEIPGSILYAIMDATAVPGIVSVNCATVNQTFDCTFECAQIPRDSY